MRIGIDASRAFSSQRTGTENYAYWMIQELIKLPEAVSDSFILYVRQKPERINWPSNVQICEIKLPYLWTQVGLAARTWTDNLDVLWVPAHTLPVLRKPGMRTVVTIHGIEYEWLPAYENKLQRWYLPLSTWYATVSASQIIAVSEFTKKQLIERLHTDGEKTIVIYEGVEDKKKRQKKDYDKILSKYGLREGKYVLFIGTVQPRKNLQRLTEAWEIVKRKITDTDLVIVGKLGWGYEDLPIDKDPGVKWLKYVPDAERDILLEEASAYVQPSITEGFGLPILEAWAAGIPVASSNGGALAEVVGEAGVVFDPEDVSLMAEKIEQVVTNEPLREQLISKGRERGKFFKWDRAAKEAYKVLTGTGRK